MSPGLKDSPEASDYLVITSTVGVGRDRFESLHIDLSSTACSRLNSRWVQVRDESQVALKDYIKTFLDGFDLCCVLIEACSDYQVAELLDRRLCHSAILTSLTKFDLLSTIRQQSREILVDTGFEFFV